MKSYGEMEVQLRRLLTSVPDGGGCSVSHPGRFTPSERAPGVHWIRRSGHRGGEEKKPARNRTPVVQPVALSL